MIAYCPHHTQHLLPREQPDALSQRYADVCNANRPSSPRIHVPAPLRLAPRVCLVIVERDELGVNTVSPVQVSSDSFRRDHMPGIDKVLIRIAANNAGTRSVWRPREIVVYVPEVDRVDSRLELVRLEDLPEIGHGCRVWVPRVAV